MFSQLMVFVFSIIITHQKALKRNKTWTLYLCQLPRLSFLGDRIQTPDASTKKFENKL